MMGDKLSAKQMAVECGSKSRYIGYDSIYNTDMSAYYSTGSVSRSFDGEGNAAIAFTTAFASALSRAE